MQREINRLSEHFIICGAGRRGRSVARELARNPAPFVIVDNDEDKLKRYSVENWLALVGDSTQEKILREAGIEKARGLVAATPTDTTNIYLLTAGADSVVSPYNFAGYRITQSFMCPSVVDFFDTAINRQLPLEIEEVQVRTGPRMVGKTLEGARIRQEMGVIVLAIEGEGSHMRFKPPPDAVIRVGDHLIAMGELNGLRRLENSATKPA